MRPAVPGNPNGLAEPVYKAIYKQLDSTSLCKRQQSPGPDRLIVMLKTRTAGLRRIVLLSADWHVSLKTEFHASMRMLKSEMFVEGN